MKTLLDQQGKMKGKSTLAIACGGTGGHFYPGLTIALEWIRQGNRAVLFLAGKHVAEQAKIAEEKQIPVIPCPALTMPKSRILFSGFFLRLLKAIFFSYRKLRENNIDATMVMGSYASAPVGVASFWANKPLFIHEGNFDLGDTNKGLSYFARSVIRSFPLDPNRKPSKKEIVLGMPLRESILQANQSGKIDKSQTLRDLNLKPNLPVLLIFGGSQGASAINKIIVDTIAKLPPIQNRFQVIHLTGTEDNSTFIKNYARKGINCRVKRYDPKIERLLLVADFVICRSGASTIFELAYFGKPALFIPLPSAKNNHQLNNSKCLVDSDAGFMVDQYQCNPMIIQKYLDEWISSPEKFLEVGRKIKEFAQPDAAKKIVAHIEKNL